MATPDALRAQQQADHAVKFIRTFESLGIGVGKRHNAACGPGNFARVAMKAGLDNTATESAAKKCGSGKKPKRIP